jgi:hypothetical protein
MIWYAFIISLTPRGSSGGRGLYLVYQACPPAKPSSGRRLRFPLVVLVLAAACTLGIGFIGMSGHIGATLMSTRKSIRSPMCAMTQISVRHDWAHKSIDYCAM